MEPTLVGVHNTGLTPKETNLGPLHKYSRCIAHLLVEILNVGAGAVSNALACFWKPIHNTGLSYQALIQR